MKVSGPKSHIVQWHSPQNDYSILQIVISIVNMTILSIVHAAMARRSNSSRNIDELLGCQQEPTGNGVWHVHNVNPIFNNNSAAR